ncbi:MAG: aminopeptidase [Erysipelotrichaceae bacterium]|nr:aminopeptidase [Erysipelotrichaceae bacterium]
MFEIKEELLNEFAILAVEVGVNVQKGQSLLIQAPIEAYKYVRKCVEVAYKKGASKVMVDYVDGERTKLDYIYQNKETLCDIPKWQIEKLKQNIEDGYARLVIIGEDPDLLKGIDKEKVKEARIALLKAKQDYQYYSMNGVGQWAIVAYPNVEWAKKVFPEETADEAMNKLWDAIIKTSRCEIGKTKENWTKHSKEIHDHCDILNKYNFKKLHFKNSLGTDLTVGLVKGHIWSGGSETSTGKFKAEFQANIPTEEVFTMPDRQNIEGRVVTSKPLSYNGNIIQQFSLSFKNGSVVEYDASNNLEVLESILNSDEGSKSLGEVALISHNSPISNSNILFYDTLFDENASCHLALGACYPSTVKGGCEMTKEELLEIGGNDSINHVDFMFGSDDMEIIGETYDGQKIEVFKNGNFVF